MVCSSSWQWRGYLVLTATLQYTAGTVKQTWFFRWKLLEDLLALLLMTSTTRTSRDVHCVYSFYIWKLWSHQTCAAAVSFYETYGHHKHSFVLRFLRFSRWKNLFINVISLSCWKYCTLLYKLIKLLEWLEPFCTSKGTECQHYEKATGTKYVWPGTSIKYICFGWQ